MTGTRSCPLPKGALLERYDPASTPMASGGYADCYSRSVPNAVSLADFVHAFYTTPVFRLERRILALAALRSTDEQARQVADGLLPHFAAWTVEERTDNQLLMCDVHARTRSWFMVRPRRDAPGSHLYFGSAIVAMERGPDGSLRIGRTYRLLLGFHRLYSRILIYSAARRLT